jgi:autoinducer 2-degrading protein
MARVGILAEFGIKPGSWQAFDALIRDHARKTLAEEPGCEQFDVWQPLQENGTPDESRITLCEIYTDKAAMDAHAVNPRMAPLREAFEPLVSSRVLTFCTVD